MSAKYSLRASYCQSLLDALKSRVVMVSAVLLFATAYLSSYAIRGVAIDNVRQDLAREAAHVQSMLEGKFNDLRGEVSRIGNDPVSVKRWRAVLKPGNISLNGLMR